MPRRKTEEPRRLPLADAQRDCMFIGLLRSALSLERAKAVVKPEHFTTEEAWLATIWSLATAHYDEYGQLIDKESLLANFNARVDADPDAYSDDDLDDADNFVSSLYGVEDGAISDRLVFNWLRHFLEDRHLRRVRETLLSPSVPLDPRSMFAGWADELNSLQTLTAGPLRRSFEAGWDDDSAPVVIRSTGIGFLDQLLEGGAGRTEANGLLGPFSGGKTLLGVCLSTQSASMAYEDWMQNGQEGTCGVSYHFSWEEPLNGLRLRAISYLAQIPRKTVSAVLTNKDYGLLSRGSSLKPYERRRYAEALRRGDRVLGEYERFQASVLRLNKCWRIVDMRGSDPDFPGRGAGSIPEVASIIKHDVETSRANGEPIHVDLVIVDYVLAAVERYLDSQNLNRDELRHHINRFPLQAKYKIGVPFNCPVWLLHQLSTDAQSYAPGHVPKMTDSAEGKAFGENLDFLFGFGNRDRENLAVFAKLKSRRVKNDPPIVVKVDGNLCCMWDKSNQYTVDTQSRAIVPASSQRLIGEATAGEPRPRGNAGPPPSLRRQQAAVRNGNGGG